MLTARITPQDLGLAPGQSFPREQRIIKNASWYDQNAIRIGTGDLAIGQPEEIAENLENGALLAVLPSHAVSRLWKPGMIDRLNRRTDERPGVEFVARNFALLIVPRCVYLPGYDGLHAYHQSLGDRPTLSPKVAGRLMKSAQLVSRVQI